MEKYETPTIVFVEFDVQDIVCASDNFSGSWVDPNEGVIGDF